MTDVMTGRGFALSEDEITRDDFPASSGAVCDAVTSGLIDMPMSTIWPPQSRVLVAERGSRHWMAHGWYSARGHAIAEPGDDADEPEWLLQIVDRLETLIELKTGWNGHGSQRVQAKPVMQALQLLLQVMRPTTVTPVLSPKPSGGLLVEWHDRGLDLEVDIPVDGEPSVWFESEQGQEWEGSLRDGGLDVVEQAVLRLS